MLSVKTCAAAIFFAAVGMCSASATTLNVSVGQDFGDFANSYYTVDATFVLPVGFSNALRSELLALRKDFFLLCGELFLMRKDLLTQRQNECL